MITLEQAKPSLIVNLLELQDLDEKYQSLLELEAVDNDNIDSRELNDRISDIADKINRFIQKVTQIVFSFKTNKFQKTDAAGPKLPKIRLSTFCGNYSDCMSIVDHF